MHAASADIRDLGRLGRCPSCDARWVRGWRWCRGGVENVVWDAYVVWDAFFFNFPQPRASLLAEVFHF